MREHFPTRSGGFVAIDPINSESPRRFPGLTFASGPNFSRPRRSFYFKPNMSAGIAMAAMMPSTMKTMPIKAMMPASFQNLR
jgi:hypothetical protein